MLLLSSRPEPTPPLPYCAWLHRVELGRLSHEAAAAMVAQASGGRLPQDVVDELIAKTDGVPLFVEEMTRAVLEEIGDRAGRAAPALTPSRRRCTTSCSRASTGCRSRRARSRRPAP